MSMLEPKEPVERPRVEIVEEIPSGEAEARRAFYAGAIASGLLCAIAGITVGFVLGVKSSLPREHAREEYRR
jgi:hypothetical protein